MAFIDTKEIIKQQVTEYLQKEEAKKAFRAFLSDKVNFKLSLYYGNKEKSKEVC